MKRNLDTLSSKQLVDTYNEAANVLGRKPVKKFKDKATAIARTDAILNELPAPAAKAKAKAPRSKDINLPFIGQLHKVRANTLNENLVVAMRGGATLSELAELVAEYDRELGNTPKDCEPRARQMVRALHTYTGLGINTVDGRLFIIES